MTLYRRATEQERQDFINYGTPEMVVRAVIVVEPCEHDRIDPHFIGAAWRGAAWCEGAKRA